MLTVSTPENNPNHPLIRCVDAQSMDEDAMVSADQKNVCAPYQVFDVLNQEYIGPKFNSRSEADTYLQSIGGGFAK